jgi:hypothetical protein
VGESGVSVLKRRRDREALGSGDREALGSALLRWPFALGTVRRKVYQKSFSHVLLVHHDRR